MHKMFSLEIIGRFETNSLCTFRKYITAKTFSASKFEAHNIFSDKIF